MALLRQLTFLLAGMDLVQGASVERMPKGLRLSALWILRTAESAARRLVVLAAEGMLIQPRPARSARGKEIKRGTGPRLPSFPLFDPIRRSKSGFGTRRKGPGPRITFIGYDVDPVFPFSPPRVPDSESDGGAKTLCHRIDVLFGVLEDLPKQARRLARWRGRAERAQRDADHGQRVSGRPVRTSPLRPGRPPGYRKRARHPVDDILLACHALAQRALKPPI